MEKTDLGVKIQRINPYRFAARVLLDRLKWDLSRYSLPSKKRLRSLKNKFEGKKAVILCNGPSLNKVDFRLFEQKDIYVFGLNKINLLFEKVNFRPSAIVAVNDYVIEQNKDFYNETDLSLFLDSRTHRFIKKRSNVTFLHSSPIKIFAGDCSMSINQGGTVTFVAMELAYHFGFSEVALVGCDHYFKEKGLSNSLAISKDKDESHFDPRYFAGGQKWQLPDLAQSEYSYAMAKEMFEATGRKIYNCTDGGHLEIFDRITLKDFLDNEH